MLTYLGPTRSSKKFLPVVEIQDPYLVIQSSKMASVIFFLISSRQLTLASLREGRQQLNSFGLARPSFILILSVLLPRSVWHMRARTHTSIHSLSLLLSRSLALSLSRSLALLLSHSLTTFYTRALFQMPTQTHTIHSHTRHKTHTQMRNTHTSMMHAHACRFYVEQLW